MNRKNKRILKAVRHMLGGIYWEKPEKITDIMQEYAYITISAVFVLLNELKTSKKSRWNSVYMDYIPKLYQVEYELQQNCFYNACYELCCFIEQEPVCDKQILPNVIDTLGRYLSGGPHHDTEKEE